MNDPNFAANRARKRNWHKFQVRGLEINLGRMAHELPSDEAHYLLAAQACLKPLIDKWNLERRNHPPYCRCEQCLDKHPVLR